jgi:hypothetical protein
MCNNPVLLVVFPPASFDSTAATTALAVMPNVMIPSIARQTSPGATMPCAAPVDETVAAVTGLSASLASLNVMPTSGHAFALITMILD